ncbi:MAG TPA: hypothetical protein VFW27_05265 [Actinoplanes sp.]|nr:hypothetical protein [Actinoplanes sp.]
MSGLNIKRIVWTIVFLGITLAAIVMEVIAGIFHPAGTIPWTEYLAKYVPWPIQLAAYVILAVWLPFHFWRHDHLRKIAFREGFSVGKGIGYNSGRKDGERLRAASIVSPAALDLVSDEKLADALRRRGWDVPEPQHADGR